jgi:hypothetical protein
MLDECARLIRFANRKHPSQGFVCDAIHKLDLFSLDFRPLYQPHSPPIMCTTVPRTERKLPPRSRVNSSTLRVEAASKTLLFAHRS